jgi:hypothetical protein
MLSRNDEIFPLWDPERNDEAVLRPGYRPTCMVSDERRNKLAMFGVNAIQGVRSAARSGPRPRTLAAGNAGSADWQYLSARRLALFIVNCIERGTRWAATARPANEVAELVATQVRVFLEGLFVAGAFGSRRVDDAFFVVCDERAKTRSRTSRDFQFLVGFAASRNNDYHSFRITHGPAGTRIQPVTLNRWNFAPYSPAELEWVDKIARQLNG